MLSIRSILSTIACFSLLTACPPPETVDAGTDTGNVIDTGVDTPPPPRDVQDVRLTGCRAATTCSACAARNTSSIACGWSISQSACLSADSTDPRMSADGSSSGNDWAPLAGLCPGSTACAANTDCVSCATSSDGCGWCATGNHCLPGIGDTGSQDGSCTGTAWVNQGNYCPNANDFCGGHSSSCDDCTNTPFCGMCEGTHTCRPGTSMGPLNGRTQEMCAGAWAWLPSDCTGFDAGVADSGATDASPTDAAPTDVAPTDAAVD